MALTPFRRGLEDISITSSSSSVGTIAFG